MDCLTVPEFQYHAVSDNMLQFAQADALHKTYCAKGLNETWLELPNAEHALASVQGQGPAPNQKMRSRVVRIRRPFAPRIAESSVPGSDCRIGAVSCLELGEDVRHVVRDGAGAEEKRLFGFQRGVMLWSSAQLGLPA